MTVKKSKPKPKTTANKKEAAEARTFMAPPAPHDDVRPFDFVSDMHAPFQEDAAIALAAAFIKDHQGVGKGVLIFGGDACDAYSISKFPRMDASVHNLQQELIATREHVLRPLREAAPKADAWYIAGNHEQRMARLVAVMVPELRGLKGLTFEEAVGLDDFNIKYVPAMNGNGILRMTPHLTFMHGDRHGVNAAKAQYDAWGTSVIFGHVHKELSFRKRWGCGRDDISMGAGCLSRQNYRDITDYTLGFISGWINFTTGEFYAQHVRIHQGKEGQFHLYSNQGNYTAVFNSRTRKFDTSCASFSNSKR